MARKYGIHGARGNMVVKEFLLNSGVDISRFSNRFMNANKVKRCTLKMPGIFTYTQINMFLWHILSFLNNPPCRCEAWLRLRSTGQLLCLMSTDVFCRYFFIISLFRVLVKLILNQLKRSICHLLNFAINQTLKISCSTLDFLTH